MITKTHQWFLFARGVDCQILGRSFNIIWSFQSQSNGVSLASEDVINNKIGCSRAIFLKFDGVSYTWYDKVLDGTPETCTNLPLIFMFSQNQHESIVPKDTRGGGF